MRFLLLVKNCLILARFDRPAGALLLLLPTLWGLWAVQPPAVYWVGIFSAGAVVMRAFGCVINDMADRDLDRAVTRTKARPLAADTLSMTAAAVTAAVFAAAALVLFFALPGAARLWALGAAALAVVYPFCKRFMPLPQAALAVAFGGGLLIADVSARDAAAPSLQAWWLFAANAMWVMAYDTIYAMADRADDLQYQRGGGAGGKIGSAAIYFGRYDRAAVSVFYALCLLWLSAGGLIFNYGTAYQVALIAAAVAVFRYWQKYKTRCPAACLSAFRANVWFGVFVFAGLAAAGA